MTSLPRGESHEARPHPSPLASGTRAVVQARCWALVPCAGMGLRAGTSGPKQYALLAGRPLVAWTLEALSRVPELEGIVVVLAPDDEIFEREVLPSWQAIAAPMALVVEHVGGDTRARSVANGLESVRARGARDEDWVLVHDAARCLVHPASVSRLVAVCRDDEVGGLLALPVPDTLKRSAVMSNEGRDRVCATVPRADMWAAQTPQMFRLGLLSQALGRALALPGTAITDEAGAIEALGLGPQLVRGDYDNIKVTWPEDFALAERLLAQRRPPGADGERFTDADAGSSSLRPAPSNMMTMPLRIGEGWDTHQLVVGRPLILGGVSIDFTHGLLGHSDADALCHAVTDALLGAAGLGDIGRHFPDTDDAFRGADSVALLAEACARVHAAGWRPVNVDATIVAQAPRLAPHIPAMRTRLAQALGLAVDDVNVKAKTAEKMGPVGEGLAMEARAVCLLARITPSQSPPG